MVGGYPLRRIRGGEAMGFEPLDPIQLGYFDK